MVVNAHILYKNHFNVTRGDPYFSLVEFIERVARAWGSRCVSNAKFASNKIPRTGSHTPIIFNHVKSDKDMRHKCFVCKRKTMHCCRECGAYVCMDIHTSNEAESCWETYHNEILYDVVAQKFANF